MSRAPAGRMQGLFKNNRNIFEAGLKKKVTPYEWGKEVAPGLLAVENRRPHARTYVLRAVVRLRQGPSSSLTSPIILTRSRPIRAGTHSSTRTATSRKDPPPRLRHAGHRQAAGPGLPLSVPRALRIWKRMATDYRVVPAPWNPTIKLPKIRARGHASRARICFRLA